MLKEIENVLHSFEKDDKCKLVLLTSDNNYFLNSIDYSSLAQSTAEKRRLSAIDLSKKIR